MLADVCTSSCIYNFCYKTSASSAMSASECKRLKIITNMLIMSSANAKQCWTLLRLAMLIISNTNDKQY